MPFTPHNHTSGLATGTVMTLSHPIKMLQSVIILSGCLLASTHCCLERGNRRKAGAHSILLHPNEKAPKAAWDRHRSVLE